MHLYAIYLCPCSANRNDATLLIFASTLATRSSAMLLIFTFSPIRSDASRFWNWCCAIDRHLYSFHWKWFCAILSLTLLSQQKWCYAIDLYIYTCHQKWRYPLDLCGTNAQKPVTFSKFFYNQRWFSTDESSFWNREKGALKLDAHLRGGNESREPKRVPGASQRRPQLVRYTFHWKCCPWAQLPIVAGYWSYCCFAPMSEVLFLYNPYPSIYPHEYPI